MSWLSEVMLPFKPDYLVVAGVEAEELSLALQKYMRDNSTPESNVVDSNYCPNMVVYAYSKNHFIVTFEKKLSLDTIFHVLLYLVNNKDLSDAISVAGWATVRTLHEQLIPIWDKRISIYPGQDDEAGLHLNITSEENRNYRFNTSSGVIELDNGSRFVEKPHFLKWPREVLFSIRAEQLYPEIFEELDNRPFFELLARAASGLLLYIILGFALFAFLAWINGEL